MAEMWTGPEPTDRELTQMGMAMTKLNVKIEPIDKGSGVNYMQTIPDSHYWTSIEMLLRDLERYKNGD